MMEHMTYPTKSPEKSSPSFPEDVEDEDEDPMGSDHVNYSSDTVLEKHNCTGNNNVNDEQVDVTMLAEEDDDDIEPNRSFLLSVDSPRHPTDSSDKKVHWSNQNVQTLLDCVEKHLDEFNIQKKHKQVWQTIGAEMESLGFTMEHCYNKWKNLRRDVRLLVNNPQKAVRNADILRRVARLILVIYPNVDATTMQGTGYRICGKSTPTTPGGPGNLYSRITSTSLHAPDSPLYFGNSRSRTPHSMTSNFHSITPNGIKHKSDQLMRESPIPATALFTNVRSDNEKRDLSADSIEIANNTNNSIINGSSDNTNCGANSEFPFLFNPAAAALLVQSQLFNDLLRQNQSSKTEELSHLDSVQQRQQLFASGGTVAKDLAGLISNSNNNGNSLNNGRCHQDSTTTQTNVFVTSLLNGINSLDSSNYSALSNPVETTVNQSTTDRLPPGSELAGMVERLRNEETVHMRLTDLVTNIADELRAAGMRRRATIDQLLEIMKGSRLPTSLNPTSKAPDASHRV